MYLLAYFLLTRLNQKYNIINALVYCQKNKGLEIYVHCIMSSHTHLLCKETNGFVLSDMTRDFKKFHLKKLFEQFLTSQRADANCC